MLVTRFHASNQTKIALNLPSRDTRAVVASQEARHGSEQASRSNRRCREESLKWGEPSYATISGSPVRLGWKKADPDRFGVFFHCQSMLVGTFREQYPDVLTFEGKRAITFHKDAPIPRAALVRCIELAHTYHRRQPPSKSSKP